VGRLRRGWEAASITTRRVQIRVRGESGCDAFALANVRTRSTRSKTISISTPFPPRPLSKVDPGLRDVLDVLRQGGKLLHHPFLICQGQSAEGTRQFVQFGRLAQHSQSGERLRLSLLRNVHVIAGRLPYFRPRCGFR